MGHEDILPVEQQHIPDFHRKRFDQVMLADRVMLEQKGF